MNNHLNFNPNGFIVKRLDSYFARLYKNYRGIDGDVWPIHEDTKVQNCDDIKALCNYVDENIMLADFNTSVVDVSNNIDFLNMYIEACKKATFNVDVIFCESTRKSPLTEINAAQNTDSFVFLGFDYGYPGADYYSCVFNDVNRIPQMSHFTLNKNGLFETENEIIEFIKLRNELKLILPKNEFEQGEFVIYKLWRYVGKYPISFL